MNILIQKVVDFLLEAPIPNGLNPLHLMRARGNLGRKWIPWVPNNRKIEIEITSSCNLSCPNCDRGVPQAPTNDRVTLGQIDRFVAESLELKWPWRQVTLIGGEPTLQKNYLEILERLKVLRDTNPNCVIAVATNGHGDKVKEMLRKTPDWVFIINSAKESSTQKFSPWNVAPADTGQYLSRTRIREKDYRKGCKITEECGMALTRFGYFPCGAGAAVSRVMGLDIGIKNLSETNKEALRDQLEEMCRSCGHFIYVDPTQGETQASRKDNWEYENRMTESWIKAIKEYKVRHPAMSLYPESEKPVNESKSTRVRP